MKGFLIMPYGYLRKSFLSDITNPETIDFYNLQFPMIFGPNLNLSSSYITTSKYIIRY